MSRKIEIARPYILFALFFFSLPCFSQTEEDIQRITAGYDKEKLLKMAEKAKEEQKAAKERALRLAKKYGWEIYIDEPDGSFSELMDATPDERPIYYTTTNVNAAKYTRASSLQPNGSLGLNLEGENMNVFVWDAGAARTTHVEFQELNGTGSRVAEGDPSSTNDHATHVTGTIIASGADPAARGMAPKAKARSYDWDSDLYEAYYAMIDYGMLLSNHSYGWNLVGLKDYEVGAYLTIAKEWDDLMYNAPYYLMVKSAGNDGNINPVKTPLYPGYDKLRGRATAKNNMVVANAQGEFMDNNGNFDEQAFISTFGGFSFLLQVFPDYNQLSPEEKTRRFMAPIRSSSSQGPTDDLRIKPDITGIGTDVYSSTMNNDNAYGRKTGTSMATPNVCGSLLLLQELYKRENGYFMKAATLKGLALHTATDLGVPGPDPIYGWGLMNSEEAAKAIISSSGMSSPGALIMEDLTIQPGETFYLKVVADGTNPLKASISWTDPPGLTAYYYNPDTIPNHPFKVLIHDLDIRLTQGQTHYPYRLTGVAPLDNEKADNTVDPYERVDVDNASGYYTITITHKPTTTTTDDSSDPQKFSLIVTGIDAPSRANCIATPPIGINVEPTSPTTVKVNWNAPLPGTNTKTEGYYRKAGGSSPWIHAFTTTGCMGSIAGLIPGANYELRLRSVCGSNASSPSMYSTKVFNTAIKDSYPKGNFWWGSVLESIRRVQLGSIDNSSVELSNLEYEDFTHISTSLQTNNIYTISASTVTNLPSDMHCRFRVSIDFNQDGDFYDLDEQVLNTGFSSSTTFSHSFSIPTHASEGPTRMRVSLDGREKDFNTLSQLQIEDYTVNITNSSASTNKAAPGNYCSSSGSYPIMLYINRLECENIQNTSGWADYQNFTNIRQYLFRDSTFDIEMHPVWTPNGPVKSQYYGVWIDFNQDGDFDDPAENVWSQNSREPNFLPVLGNFAVPSWAPMGATRMRVAAKPNGPISDDPCAGSSGSFEGGEVEDYTVIIGPKCKDAVVQDVDIDVFSATNHSITLNWAPLGADAQFDVFLSENGGVWNFAGRTGQNTWTFNGLNSSSTYDALVILKCSDRKPIINTHPNNPDIGISRLK